MENNIETQENEMESANMNLGEQARLGQAEWCFQFDNGEPVIFAWSREEGDVGDFVLNVPAIAGTAATFKCPSTGKTFSIVVREMSEETKADRDKMLQEETAETETESEAK
jgi:hypothetical protein